MNTPEISPVQAWLLAARPKTLPAAVAPVLVGIALAVSAGSFRLVPAAAALIVSLSLQIAVNLANDYFDHVKGIDSPNRKGPTRVTNSGIIAPERVRTAMLIVIGVAAVFGGYLIFVGGWPVVIIGITAIVSTLAYSGGPFPLASNGLGDLFVFIFFGLAAVCGTYYVQTLALPVQVIFSAVPPGLLITAILVVNNLRDIATDRAAGKNTLAVLLGKKGSLVEYILLFVMSYSIPVVQWLTGLSPAWVMLPWLTLPLTLPLVKTLQSHAEDGPAMNKALAGTARLSLLFSLLYAVGLAF